MRTYWIVIGLVAVLGAAALAQTLPPPGTIPPSAETLRHLPPRIARAMTQCTTTDCDGDGDPGTTDCDDRDPHRFHGNVIETSRIDHVDNDCDPSTLGPDNDHDGEVASQSCNPQLDGRMLCGADCDDTRPTINTSAIEACDNVDNNCDGRVDEGVQSTFFADADGDGFGAGAELHMCVSPRNASLRGSDCDDANPLTHPGQFELRDGIDNNCNGAIDERPLISQ